MSDKHSNEKLDNLRERLYSRGETPRERKGVKLESENIPVKKTWSDINPSGAVFTNEEVENPVSIEAEFPRKRYNYRFILVSVAVAFFVISVISSSLYLLFGGNIVSGSNISLSLSGPLTIGGGEVFPVQVVVANQNAVTIDSATLIVDYPPGTRSGEGEETELSNERISITNLAPGETRNIPLRVRVFGEENQENEIKASIEYRVDGSSATFVKTSDPLRYKISHAPVVIKVDAERIISAGQETDIILTISSNASAPLYNLLVKSEYPNGFEYLSASPAPVSGRNVWEIAEIKPEESVTINIKGRLLGSESEKVVVKFASGIAGEKNKNDLVSTLAVADTEFTIEDAFLSANVTVNGETNNTVSVNSKSQANVVVEMKNNSSNVVYDAVINVKLSGNALSGTRVSTNQGYYDANTRTIRLDSSTYPNLLRMEPGATERLSFSLQPENLSVQSPQLLAEVSLSGRRVSENNAREEVSGTIKRTIKFGGVTTLESSVVDVTAGPTPPVVGKTTNYRVRFSIQSGGNDLEGVSLTAVLPNYVTWTNSTAGTGSWNYNPSTRVLEWRPDKINAGTEAVGIFGIDFLPSASLIGRTPSLVEGIELKATDSFTDTVLRINSNDISTEIVGQRGSGVVQDN